MQTVNQEAASWALDIVQIFFFFKTRKIKGQKAGLLLGALFAQDL